MIVPMFQPIHCYETGKVQAAEVLARWLTDGRYIGPAEAGACPHWGEIDVAMIRLLVLYADAITAQYPLVLINISESTLSSGNQFALWLDEVKRLQDKTQTNIAIEVTEQVTDRTLEARWSGLKALGSAILMDDYGHENSTIERLVAYPWDGCKFDSKKMVMPDAAGVQAVAHCTRNGIISIAEQVENQELADLAASQGMGWLQGHLYGKAKPLETRIGWTKQNPTHKTSICSAKG